MIQTPDSEKRLILLAPNVGYGVGFGHVSRLARLGRELVRGDSVKLAWAVRDVESHIELLNSFLQLPVLDLADTVPHDAIVFDGVDPLANAASANYKAMFAVAGSVNEVAPVLRERARILFIQNSHTGWVDDPSKEPRVVGGGAWMLVEPVLDTLKSRGWTLVTFGGSEHGLDQTIKFVKLHYSLSKRNAGILAGQTLRVMWPWRTDVPREIDGMAEYLRGERNVPRWAATCDNVVGSFGVTTWEVLAQGVPGAYFSWTSGHRLGSETLVDGQTVINLGMMKDMSAGVLASYQHDLDHPIKRTLAFARQFLRLGLDGRGVERVAYEIKITLKRDAMERKHGQR